MQRFLVCSGFMSHDVYVLLLQVLADGRIPSSVYGAEHFLRLFVKLPEFLPHTGLTEGQMQLLTNRIEDVLRFLQYNQPQLFLSKDKYLVSGAASVPQRA